MRALLLAILLATSCGKAGFDSLRFGDGGPGGPGPDADLGLSSPGDYPGCPVLRRSADRENALLAWTAFPPGNSVADIRFARLDSTGTPLVGPVTVGVAGGSARTLDVVERDGELAVLFLDEDRLTLARIDPSGSVLDTVVVRTGVVDASLHPTSTGYLVIWGSDGTSPTGIVAARLDEEGGLDVGSINQVEAQGVDPGSAQLSNGNVYVAYGSQNDVALAELSPDATVVDGPAALGTGGRGRTANVTIGPERAMVLYNRGASPSTTLSYAFLTREPLALAGAPTPLSPANFDASAYGRGAFVEGEGFAIAHHTDSLAIGTRLGLAVAPLNSMTVGPSTIASNVDEEASCAGLVALTSGVVGAWRADRADSGAIITTNVSLP